MLQPKRKYPALILALCGGGLYPFAFAPFYLWPLAIISILCLLYSISDQAKRVSLLYGYGYGLVQFGIGVSWVYVSIHRYGNSPAVIAALLTSLFIIYLALFPALFALACYWMRKLRRSLQLLLIPTAWVACEILRGTLFTGFPWLLAGYAQLASPLAGYAPIVGVYGVSWLSALVAVLLLTLVQPQQYSRRLRGAAMVLILAIVLAGVELRQIEWTKPVGESKTVALVQGNIPQDLKWLEANQQQIFDVYWRLTEPVWQHDVVIWPESAIPLPLPYAKDLVEYLDAVAASNNTALIVGIPAQVSKDGDQGFHNVLLAIGQDATGYYAKRHLVPFGEYVPLASWLRGIIAFFDLPMSDFISGDQEQPLLSAHGLTMLPLICYEVAYPGLLSGKLQEAQVLLTVSNDTWFGHSFGPSQHLQIAQFRALEAGRPMLRGTNNGTTAIINSKGMLVQQAPSFVEAVLTGVIQGYQGLTPYGWLLSVASR